jgi:hypothetical protein
MVSLMMTTMVSLMMMMVTIVMMMMMMMMMMMVWCGVVWWQTFVAFTNETPVVDVEYLTVSRYYPSLNSARSETLQRVGTAENAVSQAPPQTPRVGILIIPRAPFINLDGRGR